jgi:hypothetical protein
MDKLCFAIEVQSEGPASAEMQRCKDYGTKPFSATFSGAIGRGMFGRGIMRHRQNRASSFKRTGSCLFFKGLFGKHLDGFYDSCLSGLGALRFGYPLEILVLVGGGAFGEEVG